MSQIDVLNAISAARFPDRRSSKDRFRAAVNWRSDARPRIRLRRSRTRWPYSSWAIRDFLWEDSETISVALMYILHSSSGQSRGICRRGKAVCLCRANENEADRNDWEKTCYSAWRASRFRASGGPDARTFVTERWASSSRRWPCALLAQGCAGTPLDIDRSAPTIVVDLNGTSRIMAWS